MSMIMNRRDLAFMLYELLQTEDLCRHDRYADHDRSIIDAVLDTAFAVAGDTFAPHAAKLDANEPTFDGQCVHIIPEVRKALDTFVEAGLMGTMFDYELGGLQLPMVVHQSVAAIFVAANAGVASYPFLTVGCANMLGAFASQEQRDLYVKPMVEGRFFGTMCLSEPQAGSSLADLKTKAVLTGDGHYLISGNKMWISAGDHDLSENIIHTVLARIPGGPPGVKGLSLFIVPKFRVYIDGRLGEKNDVEIAGLNHKMGYRGTINTLLNFGENGCCHGFLVGEPHQGLSYMFHMMNEARIGVGISAMMLGYAGYLHALDYARTRPQGRHPDNKDPASPMVPIIEHADVKRLLLCQKSYVEGALALLLYCAVLVDESKVTDDEDTSRELELLLDLLTPIAKSWPAEFCLEANKHAIQVMGGYGYTRDYPVERFYRDNRLNSIHEGTHGIQGMDVLGRKVTMHNGAAFKILTTKILETVRMAIGIDPLADYACELERAVDIMTQTTLDLTACAAQGNTRLFLANAAVYLDMIGHLVIAWMWLRQAIVAQRGLSNAITSDKKFYRGKLQACRFFFRWEVPKISMQAALLSSLDETCLSMKHDWF